MSESKKNYDENYTWANVHEDLENDQYSGIYGGCNAAWFGLSEIRANVDMNDFHKKKSADEFYQPMLDSHLKNPYTQREWHKIVTIDPMGMYATRPTMAATTAKMNVPELGRLQRDGKIVNQDGSVNTVKVGVDYVWNIPGVAKRIGFEEKATRDAYYKYTNNPTVLDEKNRVFLPPVGGCTVYIFGDVNKLEDSSTEVAVRVHDQCTGSDVFGTDICTCRPYLMFALEQCIETAQRGGVGVVVYYQKEGRSLGEVTKFRVYNARKNQKGGDTAENYFHQTESIAGITDARFQEMMPDMLLWLGITRIDWLLSMSSEKYDAITSVGIKVMQRVALPDTWVPDGAHVEINAKISAGYHTDKIESKEVSGNLRKLETIRERCSKIYDLAQQGKLQHFNLDLSKLEETAEFVGTVIKKNYPDLKVPYHSRWRHFDNEAVEAMIEAWPCNKVEKARRLIDLATVSVLLDAGAGPTWTYRDAEGRQVSRSEGLAIASFEMFCSGLFSSDVAQPFRVNAAGIEAMSYSDFCRGFQVSSKNTMVGVKGRFELMKCLASSLSEHPQFFGYEISRPGNLVDYILDKAVDNKVSIRSLWTVIIEGLENIWPANLAGIRRGDVWVYNPLKVVGSVGSDMVPFHKLSQWLSLSLLEPMERIGLVFEDMDLFTPLAEYRNGGLLIDQGILTVKDPSVSKLKHDVGSELVVEWRAMTICLIDQIAVMVREKFGFTEEEFPVTKVLEGGTWAAGRITAKKLRPDCGPPLKIQSKGNVF